VKRLLVTVLSMEAVIALLAIVPAKQLEHVNSSAWRGITRNESSSLDRSAPGSSSDSDASSGSMSIAVDDLSIRRAWSSCRLSSVSSSSVFLGLS